MNMLLRAEFLNGEFGDPALYLWQINEKSALLIDCGDLSRFTPKQLLKVQFIFISHCHMDHFYDFDRFLRIHMGTEKTVTLFGPPETSSRVEGKLQGYTWNLIYDQNLEFVVVDLFFKEKKKRITHFHSRDQFRPSLTREESWNPEDPVLSQGIYFRVQAILLDHRTPSIAYRVEEKLTVEVNEKNMTEQNLQPGPWLNDLKKWFLGNGLPDEKMTVPLKNGEVLKSHASQLAQSILIPRERHRIAYATDGAADPANRQQLLKLIEGADLFFCETCFLESDRSLADETKHFTAQFIGSLAQEAHVKKIAPFHFSKRYLSCPEKVLNEVALHFTSEIIRLSPSPKQFTL